MLERIKRLPMAVKLAVPISAAVAVGAVSALAIGGTSASNEAATAEPAPIVRSVAAVPISHDGDDDAFARGGQRGGVGAALFAGLRDGRDGDGPRFGGEREHDERARLQGIADVIGIDLETLKAGIEDGQTLAEIAVANGSTAQAVIDHITARMNERIDQAVADGELAEEAAGEIRAELAEDIAAKVNEGFDRHGEDGIRGGWLKQRLDEAADQLTALLGVTEDQLETELKAGKSLGEIATANGVEPQAVIDLLTSEAESMIDEALAEGEIDQAEANEIRAELLPKIGTFVNDGFPGLMRELEGEHGGGKGRHGYWADRDPRGGHHHDRDWRGGDDGMGQMAELSAIAEAAGTDTAEMMAGIRAGQSLADIARANGADPQAVIDLLISQANARIDAAAEAGKITAEEAAEMKAEFAESASDMVNFTMEDARRGFGKRGADRDDDGDSSTES